MCQSCAEGGRRCRDRRQLERLTVDDVRPAPAAGRPEVQWPDEPAPAQLWDLYVPAVAGEAVAALLEARDDEADITGDLLACAGAGTRMHGLEWRMKSPSSLARKIHDRVVRKVVTTASPWEVARAVTERLTDLLRYTALCEDHDAVVDTARSVVASLEERGYAVVEVEHSYVDGNPYKGLHMLLKAPAGRVFEVQVHSAHSQDVKDRIHVDYEVERDGDVPVAERALARERMEKLSAEVPAPAGLKDLVELGGQAVRTKAYPNPYRRG